MFPARGGILGLESGRRVCSPALAVGLFCHLFVGPGGLAVGLDAHVGSLNPQHVGRRPCHALAGLRRCGRWGGVTAGPGSGCRSG